MDTVNYIPKPFEVSYGTEYPIVDLIYRIEAMRKHSDLSGGPSSVHTLVFESKRPMFSPVCCVKGVYRLQLAPGTDQHKAAFGPLIDCLRYINSIYALTMVLAQWRIEHSIEQQARQLCCFI